MEILIIVPPLKSIEVSIPLKIIKQIDMQKITMDVTRKYLENFTNGILKVCLIQIYFFITLLFNNVIKIVFVKNIAVNIEQTIPTLKVVAKPLIGPEPIKDKTKAVNKVVTFASKIVINALLYPFLIETYKSFFNLNSSLMRSKIITLESTDMPTVNNNPAMPGNVSTAFIVYKTAKTIIILIINAILAIIPNDL